MSRLAAPDYAVFGCLLGSSAVIGIYYALKEYISPRIEDTEDFMLGGRKVHVVPVAMSITVSFMSAITVLGTPAEVYGNGTMYWWFVVSLLIVAVITSEVFIPTFYRVGLSSTYEYLEKRFNRKVRLLATVMFIIETMLYMGLVIYAPSLALNQVTGLGLWMSIISTGVVCIFYTCLGGIKAVIWTDVIQGLVMVGGFLALAIKGSADLGGYSEVWKICEENGRVDFWRFDTDPRYRHTVWSILIGGTFFWLHIYAVNQAQVQRYLCCKSVNHAKGAVFLNWIGLFMIISLCVINGTIMFAHYHECDPLKNNTITKYDQLIPYFALEVFKDSPGVTGLVISAVFSGSLSTVSTGISALACVTLQDIVKPHTNWEENSYTWFSRGAVVMYGAACIILAYFASMLGAILEAALSIFGLFGGPLVGLFTLGIIFPFANAIGTFVGMIVGLGIPIWFYIGKKTIVIDNEFTRRLPVSEIGCWNYTAPINITTTTPSPVDDFEFTQIYALSYSFYSCVGFMATTSMGILISLCTGGWKTRREVDPKLLCFLLDHWLFCCLPEKVKRWSRFGLNRYVEPPPPPQTKDDNEVPSGDDWKVKPKAQTSSV